MNYHKGFIAPLLLALIAILLIGGGAYRYVWWDKHKCELGGEVCGPFITEPLATSTAQTSNSQTAGWKTYTDATYGFEVKYPSSWFQSIHGANLVLSTGDLRKGDAPSISISPMEGSKESKFVVYDNVDNKISHEIISTLKFTSLDTTFKIITPTVQTSDSQTAGWKFYQDSNYSVRYPGGVLTAVSIIKKLPPEYKTDYTGMKLISSARFNLLGKRECMYGQSGLTSTCAAEAEGGIEFVVVNSPAQNLTSSIDNLIKSNITLMGKQVVKVSRGFEGEGDDDYYIPLSQAKTLIIARMYRDNFSPPQDLFEKILATVTLD